jgi:hypothetical protein
MLRRVILGKAGTPCPSGSAWHERSLPQADFMKPLLPDEVEHDRIRAGPDDGSAVVEWTHVITHVRGSHREVIMPRSHHALSRLVAAAVIAAGCLALPAGPSDAAAVRNGPIAFGRFDPALGDFSLWTADSDGTHQRWGGPDATECRALHCAGQHAGRAS